MPSGLTGEPRELALIKGQGDPAADWAKMAASIKSKIKG